MQGQRTKTGLLRPQNRGCGVREEFAGAGWEMRDEARRPVGCRQSNQTVVRVSRHRDLWLREETSRFPHSNHFIKSPARLPLFPLTLDP